MRADEINRLINSRSKLIARTEPLPRSPEAAEGGCGVLGFAANVPIAGRHLVTASQQMHNRGNGKGGGIAAAGLDPVQMRVAPDVLRSHYLIQIAYLDPSSRAEVEREYLRAQFDLTQSYTVEAVDDYREVAGLEMRPPEVVRYFCRVKPNVLARFAEENRLPHLATRQVEDEFVYQNTFRLNQRFYASLGDKRAFVLCHGRDLLVFKIVGYAEQAAAYYRLQDLTARVWISHQRYPTKGRVWHPGGAHPFIGVNEALVHNGDFANYHRVTEYLRQRNIVPLFLTDTEVSVLLFDLWDRVYGYPLEIVLEALAPTTERDFDMLPPAKQSLYRAVQHAHLSASPDGPWFFIIARSKPDNQEWQLLGITDTSMLRPQVFALYENDAVQIGLIASERQAINACLRSLSAEDARFQPLADKYWVARGGSYTDGGAFVFAVSKKDENYRLVCRDKFGKEVKPPHPNSDSHAEGGLDVQSLLQQSMRDSLSVNDWFARTRALISAASLSEIESWLDWLKEFAVQNDGARAFAIDALTMLRDQRFDLGSKKRSAFLAPIDRVLYTILRAVAHLDSADSSGYRRIAVDCQRSLRSPRAGEQILVIDASGFPAEGETSAARLITRAYALGWRRFIAFDWRGARFAGCGLGEGSDDVRIDLYGDVGDYLGSGLDGAQIFVHGDAQDQVGQILKRGQLVIHGDVGQTFLYGAKGGEIFVRGSAAGRPLINAVGCPRAIINGTCLDYLAESFMAGDPLNGGGFVILNGVTCDEKGNLVELDTPYPGGNLFSLASGGAIYLRDPHGKVDEEQLNGGQFAMLTDADWQLIEPYLRRNEELFNIKINDLLRDDGKVQPPSRIYRKVQVKALEVLH